jgi:hypothetical protein
MPPSHRSDVSPERYGPVAIRPTDGNTFEDYSTNYDFDCAVSDTLFAESIL